MISLTKGFALRAAAFATALVMGPATLAPGTAQAPTPSRAGADGVTAAQKFAWGVMQWDFAWEFGESLASTPYRGADSKVGSWTEDDFGSGRAVKYGGGVEFQSGDKQYNKVGPDWGDSWLTLHGQPAKTGRWEIRERGDQLETNAQRYRFVIELIPDDPTLDPCQRSITIADVTIGDNSLKIGATGGTTKWTKTFADGYPQDNTNYAFGLQITGRRVTWFAAGQAIASTGASGARPTVPMTLRMRMIGQGAKEMNKTTVKVDWARGYDLTRGKLPPTGAALTQGTNRC
jgi:hypothetical protein